jgi:outer membrane protein TolC
LRYERGLADNLEIIDAENNVLQAEASLLGANIDRTLAFLNVQRASGALNPDRFSK